MRRSGFGFRVSSIFCLTVLLTAPGDAGAEAPGPFGPILQATTRPFQPSISDECAPDVHGVVVRMVNTWNNDHWRPFIRRTGPAGMLETPFPFDRHRNRPIAIALACDGLGGFAVLWIRENDHCLRMRTFDRDGEPLSASRTVMPSCEAESESTRMFDHRDGSYRVIVARSAPGGGRVLTLVRFDATGEVVEKSRLRRIHRAWDGWAARAGDGAVLVSWVQHRDVYGQIIGMDGSKLTEPFRISGERAGATYLEPIEDLEDGTMIVWWDSYWQESRVGRRIAVTVPAPSVTTTTTTLPGQCESPSFEDPERLQGLSDDGTSQFAWSTGLAAGPDGTAVAVWMRQVHVGPRPRDYRREASYARRDPATGRWSSRRAFADSGDVSWMPHVVTDGDGTWMAMWTEIRDDGCAFVASRSDDNGMHWSSPTAVVRGAWSAFETLSHCNYMEFHFAADGGNTWIVAWPDALAPAESGMEIPAMRISRSLDRGVTWSEPYVARVIDTWPWGKFTLAASGTWGAAWSIDFGTGGGQVLFSRSTDAGATWGEPVLVAGTSEPVVDGSQHAVVDVATDGTGNWLAAWTSNDPLGDTVGRDWDILVSRSTDDGITWSAPSTVAAYAQTDDATDFHPSVTSDRHGNWLLAWNTSAPVAGASGFDMDLVVASSDDVGVTWTTPVALHPGADSDRRIDYSAAVESFGERSWVAVALSQNERPSNRGVEVLAADSDPVCR